MSVLFKSSFSSSNLACSGLTLLHLQDKTQVSCLVFVGF